MCDCISSSWSNLSGRFVQFVLGWISSVYNYYRYCQQIYSVCIMCGGTEEDNRVDNEDAGQQLNFGSKYQYDPDFTGPKKRRSCTDVLCLALFTVFLVLWAVLSVFAYIRGSPENLLYPTDSFGKRCGVDEGVRDKPFLLFFDLTRCAQPAVIHTGCPTPQVCVEECPTEDFSSFIYSDDLSRWDKAEVQKQLICTYGYDKSRIKVYNDLRDAVIKKECAPWYLKSQSILGRCLPIPQLGEKAEKHRQKKVMDGSTLSTDELLRGLQRNFFSYSGALEVGEMILQDLFRVWPYILFGLFISMVVCLFFILIMRFLAGLMVWLSITGVIALLSFGVYLCYSRYASLSPTATSPTQSTEDFYLAQPKSIGLSQIDLTDIFRVNFKSYFAKRDTWLVLLIITASLLAIILLILIFLRKRIRIAIELIREASRAVGSVTSSLLFPVFPWIVQLMALAWGLSVALYLASSGKAEYRVTNPTNDACGCNLKPGDVCIPSDFEVDCYSSSCSCQFFAVGTDKYVPWLQAFNLFGTLWLLFFISAAGEMVLAGVFGTWYWTWNKAVGIPFFAVTGSIWRTLRYHIGTLAFGSLLIAICRFIRIMLEYIHHKLKKRDNKVVQCLLCCLRCCFWCLEKFLRFLNRNAYVMCAIHGTNFCKSAKDAFNLLLRNVIRVVVLDKVTDFLLFLGKILIVTGMTVGAYYVFGNETSFFEGWVPQLNYYFLPIIVIAIGTYFIATVFFGVYAMAIDTLFLCFLEDSERNDGSAEKPYFMSKNLMKILGKKNLLRK